MILRGFLKDAGLFLRMPLILISIAIYLSSSPVEGFLNPKFYRGDYQHQNVLQGQKQENNFISSLIPTTAISREDESESMTMFSDVEKPNHDNDNNEIVISTKQHPSKSTRPFLPLHFGIIFNYFNARPRSPQISGPKKRFSMFSEGGYPAGAGVAGGGSYPYYESNSKPYRHRYCFFNPVSCFRR